MRERGRECERKRVRERQRGLGLKDGAKMGNTDTLLDINVM